MITVEQLFELLKKSNNMKLLYIESNISIEDNLVKLTPWQVINKDDVVSFNYYFYHHLNKEFPRKTILEAIENKDFNTFIQFYHDWDFKDSLVYLPDDISLFCNEEFIGSLSGIWRKDIFELIDSADYECG